MGDDYEDWDSHRELVEAARIKRIKNIHLRMRHRGHKIGGHKKPGPKKRKKKVLTKRQKMLRDKFAGITTHEIYQELGRRGSEKRWAEMTPEKRKEAAEKRAVVLARSRAECMHDKFAPKQRRAGKDKGRWYCPSCLATVAAPRVKASGELETVT